jgi:hypothetical protein
MTTITEILGGAQILLGISFDIQECFEEHLDEEHRAFLEMIRIIEEELPIDRHVPSGRGRPPIPQDSFWKAFLALNFFQANNVTGLLHRLKSDANLRKICEFSKVPSAATFSRRMAELAKKETMSRIIDSLARKYFKGRIIGHVSRDSTAIEAREKPANKKKDVALEILPKRKRGRPRKGESRPEKKVRRLTRQLKLKPGKALAALDSRCNWGCKRNSQGNVTFWKGYKLHLDVSDFGIPITAVLTGANVHDSQAALPMAKLTERKVTHLYDLMDSAYDVPEIREYEKGKGRVALIDFNKRRCKEPLQFDPAEKERFKGRSTVERANSHLKDRLIPAKIFVRGIKKVSFQILCGVVCLSVLKILQYIILPQQEACTA